MKSVPHQTVAGQKDEVNSFCPIISWCNNKSFYIHVKGCLEDAYPDHIILQQITNDLRSNNTLEEITDKKLNLVASAKTNGHQVFISGLVVRNDNLNQ